MFQVILHNYGNEKKSIFFHFRIKLLTGLYITIELLFELSAHFCYGIKVYW